MLIKRALMTFSLAAGLMAMAGASWAAPYLRGGVQELEDQDAEVLIRPDGQGGYNFVDTTNPAEWIQPGDLFAGVIKIQKTSNPDVPGSDVDLQGQNETFTAIFLIENRTCTSSGGSCAVIDGFNDTLTFGSVAPATWVSIFGAGGVIDISSAIDFTDLDGGGTGLTAGTAALLFNGIKFDDAFDDTGTLASSMASFVAGGTLQHEFGFTGLGAASEFWTTRGEDAAIPFLGLTNNPTNRFSLNVTAQWAGAALDPHNYLGSTGDFNFSTMAQLQGKGDFQSLGANSPWPVGTDTNLYIKPLPEPGSIALMALGLLGLGFASRRRA